MEIQSSSGLVLILKAEWCQYLLRNHSSVVEIASIDDPYLFDTLSHPGMVFVNEILQTSSAPTRIRLSRQDVIIVVGCENGSGMERVRSELAKCITMHDTLFSLISES